MGLIIGEYIPVGSYLHHHSMSQVVKDIIGDQALAGMSVQDDPVSMFRGPIINKGVVEITPFDQDPGALKNIDMSGDADITLYPANRTVSRYADEDICPGGGIIKSFELQALNTRTEPRRYLPDPRIKGCLIG